MRILHVTHAYPRHGQDLAGAFLARLTEAQAARHEVSVLAPADGGWAGEETVRDVRVRRVRYAPAAWETLAYRGTMVDAAASPRGALAALGMVGAFAAGVAREARAGQLDLVHAHWWVPGGVGVRLAHAVTGIPYVVTLHGTDVSLFERGAAVRRAARWVLGAAGAVTAVSSYLAAKAAKVAGLPSEGVRVQPMPIDTRRYGRRSAGGAGIVTVGRLTAQKHVETIVDAVAVLRRGGTPVDLTIVGDGPARAQLEERAAAAGIGEATRFTGTVPPEALPEAIGDADVFAFAAEREGLGLALVEALLAGVPVVAVRSGGVVDVVPADGVAGRLVSPGDAEAMARALRATLDAGAAAREAAAAAGDRLRERFRPDAAADFFDAVYGTVLSGGAAHA